MKHPDVAPTSFVLEALLREAPSDHVTLAWLLENLRERSFGIVILIMAVIALVPGASLFIGLLLAIPAYQMMRARRSPVFPEIIARRTISTRRLGLLVRRLTPVLRWLERFIRPRWRTPIVATRRIVGFIVLLLGAALLVPLPFSHVVPALVIMLVSFAYLEEDGILLSIALIAAVVALAAAAATIWVTVIGIDLIDPP